MHAFRLTVAGRSLSAVLGDFSICSKYLMKAEMAISRYKRIIVSTEWSGDEVRRWAADIQAKGHRSKGKKIPQCYAELTGHLPCFRGLLSPQDVDQQAADLKFSSHTNN